eukprot:scaffold20483_cov101-Isochrysis_galbana.AAC.3
MKEAIVRMMSAASCSLPEPAHSPSPVPAPAALSGMPRCSGIAPSLAISTRSTCRSKPTWCGTDVGPCVGRPSELRQCWRPVGASVGWPCTSLAQKRRLAPRSVGRAVSADRSAHPRL